MSKQPAFVDLNGHTARVDPQRGATSYIRLSISTEQAHSQETGEVIARPQAVEAYITAEQAESLADALYRAREVQP